MRVRVEPCDFGNHNHYYRCTFNYQGKERRELIRGETWTRRESTILRNRLENNYGIPRRSVRIV